MTITAQTDTPTITDLINDTPNLWLGPSGEQVTGQQAAHHLDTTRNLLARTGWTRTPDADSPPPDAKAPLRDFLTWFVSVIHPTTQPQTLTLAMYETAYSSDGDLDTRTIAERLLDIVIHHHTGHPYASHTAWTNRIGRTWPDVEQLLIEAAAIARQHGPTT